MPSQRALWPYLSAFYLTFQSLGALLWWGLLFVEPHFRAYFHPADTADAALMAFFLPDAIFFIGAALWAAVQLCRNPGKAVLPLALHVGGASYAALYCVAQYLLTGEAALAALFMLPPLFIGLLLLWKIRSSLPTQDHRSSKA